MIIFLTSAPKKAVFVAPAIDCDVIVRHIIAEGTMNPSADANWTFAPIAGTTVVFDGKDQERRCLRQGRED